jgi:hypothetical protein
MQTKSTDKTKELPIAVKLLSEGLQEAALQLMRGDIGKLAKLIDMSEPAIRPYFRGEVSDWNTGSTLLAETRKFILDRENSIKKLVA